MKLLDSGSAQAFTLRHLADELGIGVMTLYGYFESKSQLLDGVAHMIITDLWEADAAGQPWDQRLRSATHVIYRAVSRHPNITAAMRGELAPNHALFSVREGMLRALRDARFAPDSAIQILGVLSSYAEGFAAAHSSGRALTSRIQGLPAEQFPLLHASAGSYALQISDDAFELGLELLMRGLRAEAAAQE